MDTPGQAFVAALSRKDEQGLRGLLTAEVDFAGLTPNDTWSAHGPDEVLATLLGQWFEPDDEIVEVRAVDAGSVGDRERVTYRFGLSCDGIAKVTEQHAVYEVDGAGRIQWLRLMCSGFRPDAPTPG